MARLTRYFLSIDPRTLGLTRIFLGLLLLLDLSKRTAGRSLWYTSEGLLPSHPFMSSSLFALTRPNEVASAFALIACVYVCFLIGWKTRVMHLLSWLSLLNLQARTPILENGGDYVFCALMLWTLFLPMGRRLSLDAHLRATRPDGPVVQGRDDKSVISLAVLALMTQISVIYFFNAVHKTGTTWQDGTAVYWLLHQGRVVTSFGVWLREHSPLGVLRALTYGTRLVELVLPFLILSPWGRPYTRRAAILLVSILHTGIALVSNVGMFSPAMMVFSMLLIEPEDWRSLQPSAFADSSSSTTPAYARAARASGLTPARTVLATLGGGLREIMVAALMVVATSQLLIENRAVPPGWRIEQPRSLGAAVRYLRLNQGWSMFAPDAPRTDMSIVVDAITVEGRHVDPYNEVGARIADPRLRQVPARLGYNVYFCDYTVRIAQRKELHDALSRWIMAYDVRTGRPADRIVSFDAYVVEQDNPAPGRSGPTSIATHVFLRGATPSTPQRSAYDPEP